MKEWGNNSQDIFAICHRDEEHEKPNLTLKTHTHTKNDSVARTRAPEDFLDLFSQSGEQKELLLIFYCFLIFYGAEAPQLNCEHGS